MCVVLRRSKTMLNHCWCDVMVLLLWIVRWYEMVIFSLFVWIFHLHYCEKEWELREDVPFRGTYRVPRWILYFEGRITRRDGYYLSRNVSRTVMVTIIEDCIARCDRCMDIYVPHGSWTERQPVCIIRSDMHHYTWHWISLHCTSLLLVNMILCVADLVSAFLWNLWLMNIEPVVEDMKLLECCWRWYEIMRVLLWRYVLCKQWVIRLCWLYACCSCGGSVGVVGVPGFFSLNLCLEVCLLSAVWFRTHLLLL